MKSGSSGSFDEYIYIFPSLTVKPLTSPTPTSPFHKQTTISPHSSSSQKCIYPSPSSQSSPSSPHSPSHAHQPALPPPQPEPSPSQPLNLPGPQAQTTPSLTAFLALSCAHKEEHSGSIPTRILIVRIPHAQITTPVVVRPGTRQFCGLIVTGKLGW
jgi:hypothetical protein